MICSLLISTSSLFLSTCFSKYLVTFSLRSIALVHLFDLSDRKNSSIVLCISVPAKDTDSGCSVTSNPVEEEVTAIRLKGAVRSIIIFKTAHLNH
jgi:hypothetical protein